MSDEHYTAPLIEVRGDARSRGRQYGEAAREQIRLSIDFYRDAYVRPSGLSWQESLDLSRRWIPLVEDYLPGITDEIRGVAEGSGRTFEEILWMNCRAELTKGSPFDGTAGVEGCTVFAVTGEASGDGHVYTGQNWDWRVGTVDTVVAIRIVQPPKPTVIMQVEAGQIGRQGANSAGIALKANGLNGSFPRRVGIPSPFIRRRVLDSANMHDALQAVFSPKQAFCSNLLITHREGVAIDLETTPGRHGWLYPTAGILVHTNHFISHIPEHLTGSYRPSSEDSLYRIERMEKVLRKAGEARDPAAMRGLIASGLRDHFGMPHSVCNHPDERDDPLLRNQTVASSIVDLTAGEYYIALGTPCNTDYQKLPWGLYQP